MKVKQKGERWILSDPTKEKRTGKPTERRYGTGLSPSYPSIISSSSLAL
jgi:hypothetical protein